MVLRIGTSQGDYFTASDDQDIFTTFSGSDTIETGGGNDFVFAGLGSDTIVVGSGNNFLRGGWGADTFVFGQDTAGVSYVRDFESGSDLIDLSGLDVSGLDDVTTFASRSGSFLFVDDVIIHINLAPNELSASDFIFA